MKKKKSIDPRMIPDPKLICVQCGDLGAMPLLDQCPKCVFGDPDFKEFMP